MEFRTLREERASRAVVDIIKFFKGNVRTQQQFFATIHFAPQVLISARVIGSNRLAV